MLFTLLLVSLFSAFVEGIQENQSKGENYTVISQLRGRPVQQASPSFPENNAKALELFNVPAASMEATSIYYTFTGAPETFVVPTGVTSLRVQAYGAAGASSSTSTGGLGGYISSTIPVTPDQILFVNVGGAGGTYTAGYNGGGIGYCVDMTMALGAGGGGGSTDLTDYAGNLLITAGGGGGGAYDGSCTGMNGGGGGGATGEAGGANPIWAGSYGGGGGSQISGGVGGYIASFYNPGESGSYRSGGDAGLVTCGAGGGGGYYGGGGGSWTGGGGGSSYSIGVIENNVQSVRSGNGYLQISYTATTITPTNIPTAAPTKIPTVVPTKIATHTPTKTPVKRIGIDVSSEITVKNAKCFKDAGVVHFISRGFRTTGKVDPKVCINLERASAAGIETIDTYLFFDVKKGEPENQLKLLVNFMTEKCPSFLNKVRFFLDIEYLHWHQPTTKGYDTLNKKLYKNLIDATTKYNLSFGVYTSYSQWEATFKDRKFTYGNYLPLWYSYYEKNNVIGKETLGDFVPFGGWTKADVVLKQHTQNSKKYCNFNADLNWDPTWK